MRAITESLYHNINIPGSYIHKKLDTIKLTRVSYSLCGVVVIGLCNRAAAAQYIYVLWCNDDVASPHSLDGAIRLATSDVTTQI